jgi:hypothetical protein
MTVQPPRLWRLSNSGRTGAESWALSSHPGRWPQMLLESNQTKSASLYLAPTYRGKPVVLTDERLPGFIKPSAGGAVPIKRIRTAEKPK